MLSVQFGALRPGGRHWHERGSGLGVVGDRAPVSASPRRDLGPLPDFAHFERDLRRGEVLAVDELLDPLTADAEHPADLSRTHEVMHGGNHSQHDSGHLTMGQEYGKLVS